MILSVLQKTEFIDKSKIFAQKIAFFLQFFSFSPKIALAPPVCARFYPLPPAPPTRQNHIPRTTLPFTYTATPPTRNIISPTQKNRNKNLFQKYRVCAEEEGTRGRRRKEWWARTLAAQGKSGNPSSAAAGVAKGEPQRLFLLKIKMRFRRNRHTRRHPRLKVAPPLADVYALGCK